METNYFENPKIAKQWIHSIETKDHWLKNETVYPAIQEWIDANEIKQVIDLGCGQGNALEFLAIDEYIGIDSSETLINRALELYGSHFWKINIYSISGVYESVISVMSWFHLEDLNKASERVFDILGDSGKFCIATFNPECYYNWEHSPGILEYYNASLQVGNKTEGAPTVKNVTLDAHSMYVHSRIDYENSFKRAGFKNIKMVDMGKFGTHKTGLFMMITGEK